MKKKKEMVKNGRIKKSKKKEKEKVIMKKVERKIYVR